MNRYRNTRSRSREKERYYDDYYHDYKNVEIKIYIFYKKINLFRKK